MRITEGIRLVATLQAESAAATRMAQLSSVASSGQKVQAPSDDPVAYAEIAKWDARISTLQGRSDAATRAAGDLDLAEGALASAGDLLTRAKEIALQGANGSMDATSRAISAQEVTSLREQLIALANTRGTTGYIFGGTQTGAPPIDATGAFVGNANSARIEIADGVTVGSSASGANAFTTAGTGGRDVIADLQSLATALSTNDTNGISAAISQLDDGARQMLAARTDAGVSAERLRSAVDVIGTSLVSIRTARASSADADAPQVLSDLEAAKTAYERSVAVTKELLSLTTSGQ